MSNIAAARWPAAFGDASVVRPLRVEKKGYAPERGRKSRAPPRPPPPSIGSSQLNLEGCALDHARWTNNRKQMREHSETGRHNVHLITIGWPAGRPAVRTREFRRFSHRAGSARTAFWLMASSDANLKACLSPSLFPSAQQRGFYDEITAEGTWSPA